MKLLFTRFALIACLCIGSLQHASAQSSRLDSLFANRDSTYIMDSLLKDFNLFLDSLSRPTSFFTVSLGIGNGYFSFDNQNSVYLTAGQKAVLYPSAGYYHKSGLGISTTGFMLLDGSNSQFYQVAITPSFDYIRSKSISTGIAFTRYFEKDSLPFYTTPIENEVFTYFSYKKSWLRPTLSFSYGWGSNTEYQEKQTRIWRERLQQFERGYIYIKEVESVKDFLAIFSVKHDFVFYDLLTNDDGFRFTPVALISAGTQSFGFNTSYQYSYNLVRPTTQPSNQKISDRSDFMLQSASIVLRSDYSIGKFFILPQVLFDYYIPATEKPLNIVYSVTTGFNF